MALAGGNLGAIAACALAAACLVPLGGCGDEPEQPPIAEPAHPLTRLVHELQEARADGDHRALCERMTRSARRQAGAIAHGEPTSCVRDVRRALGMIERGGGWEAGDPPRVVAVARRGPRRATATVTDDAWRAAVPFAREGGRWRLDGFFGVGADARRRAEAAAPRRPFPAAPRGATVAARDSAGERCRDLSIGRYSPTSSDRYLSVTGGCVVKLSADLEPIRMLTPFGAFEFSECRVDYRVSIDGDGRALVDDWEVVSRSPRVEDGCGDVNPCTVAGRYVYRPWKARLSADGDDDRRLRMDMCLRTCVGDFVGDYSIRLEPDDAGWKATPTDHGATGFLIDGDLDVGGGEDLRLP